MASPASRTRASAPASVAGPAAAGPSPAKAAAAPRRLTGKPAVRLPAPVPGKKSGGEKAPAAEGAAAAGKIVDPRLKRSLDKVRRNAASLKKHPPASDKADEAQAAAVSPANERLAGAQAGRVEDMKSAEVKKPEPNSFLELLRQEIEKALPKNIEQTDNYLDKEDTDKLKGSLTGNINDQKAAATGDLKSATQTPPDPATIPPKDVTPMPSDALPAPALEAVDARNAMPAPKTDKEVSLQQSKVNADKQFKDNKITPTQLTKANDSRFTAVLTAKGDLEAHADAAPIAYREDEQKTLTKAVSRAVAVERRDVAGMKDTHGKAGSQVKSRQQLAKERDEARRKEVADQIEKIFGETKLAVEDKLASLETDVSKMFDEGLEKALKDMKDDIEKRKDAWKDDRYGGLIFNFVLWGYDKLKGIDKIPAIKQIYVDGNKKFTEDLDALVVRIAGVVESRLKDAKDEVAKGQKRIHEYVESLPKDLKEVGRDAEKEVSSRFDELRQGIEDKKNDLAQNLAQRYKEARDKADESIKEMQAEDKGLVTAFIEKLGEIIEILRNFKRRVMAMLKKAENAIDLIISDPIGFLKNLLSAIKRGVNQFADHIWEHLKEGFMVWLFGSLAEMGITLPKDFSLPSILQLVLDVLGITYAKIRGKVVKIIGERNVALLEAAWDLVKALITGGPEALWEQIKEYLGNLKEMVFGAIQEWLVSTIIKSAITKLATMFNPVGAIIQAIMLIYNTVMFFIERINQILDFVEAIVSSVYNIATGAIGSAADWIEKSLARTIPIIIGFLARLLGLSGLTEKIRGFILKVQTKVDHAIDKVIEKIVGGVKKLFAAGKAVAGKVARKIVQWWKARKSFKVGSASHSLFFTGEGPQARMTVKSIQRPLDEYVRVVRNAVTTDPAHEANRSAYLATLGPDIAPDNRSAAGDENTVTGIQQKIYLLKTRVRSTGETEDVYATYTDEMGEKVNRLLDLLAQKLSTLPDPDYKGTTVRAVRPASVITYQGLHTTPKVGQMTGPSQDGKGVDALLTARPGSEKGSMASHESVLYVALKNQRGIEATPGHILNHHLYGSGSKAENIAPITKSVNNAMAATIERTLQKMVLGDNKAVHYVVNVVWPTNAAGRGGPNSLPEDKQFPERVDATLTEKRFDFDKFKSLAPAALDKEMEKWGNWTISAPAPDSPAKYTLVVPNTPVGLSRIDKLKAKRLGDERGLTWTEFYKKNNLNRLTPEQRAELEKL